MITSGTKPDNLLPLSFLKNEALRPGPGGFHSAPAQAEPPPFRKFTIPSQKVCKPSNIFLDRSGIIIPSGAKPDNLLPLSFLKNEALRLWPGGSHFAAVLIRSYVKLISRWAAFIALWRATPRMGAKITATTPLNTEEGAFSNTPSHAPSGVSPLTSRPL